ncbi:MAG: serine/threonine protein kinase [Proteobacteria bacterium]|nr:serine/threonine protein kinase [Pseudomonadota bacterium]MCP4915389.1 serine/threonine protein kinase [Pseudomonadota bacterium]
MKKGLEPFPEAIGPYTPLSLLGRGGMAAVYLCVSPAGLEVAVKWLNHSSPRIRLRFEREGRILQRLRHPNVVRLLDRGLHDGRPYLVMEYVEGRDLRVYSRKLKLRPAEERAREVRRIGLAVCDALAVVHAAGVVHRDVKPSNVLLDRSGRVVLTDFGVVKDLDGDAEATAVGVLVGTAGYCSPEQIRGTDIDHRADMYGLGCTLHYMLTGQRPYPAKERRVVMQAHLHEAVASCRALDPSIPTVLEATVMRLMAKDPVDRYANAQQARAALAASGDGQAPAPLAGRRRYVDAVSACLDAVDDGHAQVVRAVGPSGSGRRWLLEVVEDLAGRRGIDVLIARDRATLTAALIRVRRGDVLVVGTRFAVGPGVPVTDIVLEPLGLADVRRTVVSVAPDTPAAHAVAERLYRASGGHPAWLLAILDTHRTGKHLDLPDPVPIPPLVHEKVEELEMEAGDVLGALAVLQAPADIRLIEQVCQLPADEILEFLVEAGVALRMGTRWGVLGEVVARAALEALPDPMAVHRRAAAALLRISGNEARVRQHRIAAGEIPIAVTAGRPQTEAARAVLHLHLEGRFADARTATLELLGRARGLRDRPLELTTLRVLGCLLLDQGRPRLAEARLADAVALARALEDDPSRRAAHIMRASATLDARPGSRGASASALDRIHRALTRVRVEPDGWEVVAAAVRARASAAIGDSRSWERAVVQAEAGLDGLSPELRLRAELELARAALAAGANEEAVRRADGVGARASAEGWLGIGWLAVRVRTRALGRPVPDPGSMGEGLDERELEALRGRAWPG